MQDTPQHFQRDRFTVSTDRQQIDLAAVLALLRQTPWGGDLTADLMARAIANSVCFGLYGGDMLLGFARVVSDLATYAYLTDVVIDESCRRQGLGRWLIECILAHPDFQNLRRIALVTLDAHGLYLPFGFSTDTGAHAYLELRTPPQCAP